MHFLYKLVGKVAVLSRLETCLSPVFKWAWANQGKKKNSFTLVAALVSMSKVRLERGNKIMDTS